MANVDASAIRAWIEEFAHLISVNKEKLTELDSAIGDADHGINMDRGMTAVLKALAEDTPAALLKRTGMTLVSTVGGASGPLYGTAFLRMASAAGDAGEIDAQRFAKVLRAGTERGRRSAPTRLPPPQQSPRPTAAMAWWFSWTWAARYCPPNSCSSFSMKSATGSCSVPLPLRKGLSPPPSPLPPAHRARRWPTRPTPRWRESKLVMVRRLLST
jgi:Dak2 domain-containing protein